MASYEPPQGTGIPHFSPCWSEQSCPDRRTTDTRHLRNTRPRWDEGTTEWEPKAHGCGRSARAPPGHGKDHGQSRPLPPQRSNGEKSVRPSSPQHTLQASLPDASREREMGKLPLARAEELDQKPAHTHTHAHSAVNPEPGK